MIQTCADRGYAAVEFDNLDSWTRFDGTPREGDVPFGNRVIAIEYRRRDFQRTCRVAGERLTVVLRDLHLTRPGSRTYRYAAC